MARGGKRPGAGRPKGSKTKRTADKAITATLNGEVTPVEVILQSMRDEYVRQMKLPVTKRNMDKACDYAKAAAPYCHPRLSAVSHTGADDGPIEFKDVSALDVARRYAFLLAEEERVGTDNQSTH